MNFIYETGLEEASKETKALIQEIFLEVQNYAKTLPEKFIPFNSFKKVVDTQYERLNLTALVLLKNKLLKYHEEGLFAQVKEEFDSLINTMINEDITVFDVSSFEDNVQRELISFAISQTNYYLKDVYVFVNIDNFNSDKKLLKQIYKSVNIYPITVCDYGYKYISELKQLSKNAILFSPDKIIDDFANLTVFLNKLNAKEFVVYGKQTNYLALIGDFNYTQEDLKFKEIPPISEFTTNVQIPTAKPIEEISQEIDEQIVKDVDELYTAPSVPISQMNNQQQFIQPQEIEITETLPENENSLTEADLDLIDNNVNDLRFEETPPKIINILEDGVNEGVNNELNSEIPTSNEIDNDLSFNEEISQQEPIIINEIPPLHNSFDENTQTQLQEIEITEEISQENTEYNEEQANLLKTLPVDDVTPMVPIYSAEVTPLQNVEGIEYKTGEIVIHPKYGQGTVENLISYGEKTLIAIQFESVGRRLLDPLLSELKKV